MEITHIVAIAFVALLVMAIFKEFLYSWLKSHPVLLIVVLLAVVGGLLYAFLGPTGGGMDADGGLSEEATQMVIIFSQVLLMFIFAVLRKPAVGAIFLITSLITLFYFNLV